MITKETYSWQCPVGYAGPDQCVGGQCDGNLVHLGRAVNGDCCDACSLKEWVDDHYQYNLDPHSGCSSGPCCNCWRFTGASLASEPTNVTIDTGNATANSHGHERRLLFSQLRTQGSKLV